MYVQEVRTPSKLNLYLEEFIKIFTQILYKVHVRDIG